MPRPSLPQNYKLSDGIVLDDFETLGSWVTAGGTTQANTTQFKTGTQSVKLISPVGSNVNITKTVALDFSKDDGFEYMAYFDDIPSNTAGYIFFYISSSTTIATWFVHQQFCNRLHKGWNRIRLSKDDFGNNGELWTNQMVRIRLRLDPLAGQSATASLDSLLFKPKNTPKVLIHFDDALKSVYTEAYPYMNAKGMKGSIFAIKNIINTPTTMSLTELATVYEEGWCVGNHTANHPNLSTLGTQAEVETELADTTSWLDSLGFGRTSRYVAYPQGGFNDNVMNAMQKLGMKSGRTILGRKQAAPMDDYRLLPAYSITNINTLADVKKFIDTSVKAGGTVRILFHDLVTTPSTSIQWAISDFRALIDYIASLNVSVVTEDEWMEGLTNPRYRSKPLTRTLV